MKKRPNRRRSLLRLVILCAILFMLLRWFEHSQVYHPGRRAMDPADIAAAQPFEDLTLTTKDGVAINAWYFAARTNSPRGHFAVILCHGNAGTISDRVDLYRAWQRAGVAVLAFDYRGFGRSRGRPSEEGTYLDAQASVAWLRGRGFKDFIAYGESLGGAVATELSLREPMRGLVLQSTFTSIADIGAEFFPWLPVRWLATIRYDTRAKLPRLKLPVLVMHSRTDEVAAFHHAEANFAAANQPKLFWEIQNGHNEALEDPVRFEEGIESFLQLVESTPAP
ncbi:MAG: alpha/beta hydrolase [Verrucomicrobiota bacterium]